MRRRVVLAVVFLAAFILLFRLILLAGEFDTVITAARFAAAPDDHTTLRAFLYRMPKGGDLHTHLAGAVYAERFLAWAAQENLCVDLQSVVVPKTQCDRTGMLPVADAMRDQMLYDRLVNALSMRDFLPTSTLPSGHDEFFATFDRFDAVSGSHFADMTIDQLVVELLVAHGIGGPHRPRTVALRFWHHDLLGVDAKLLLRGPGDEALGVDGAGEVGVEVGTLGHAMEESAQRRSIFARRFEGGRRDDRVEFARQHRDAQHDDEGRQQDDGKNDPTSQGLSRCGRCSAKLAVGRAELNRGTNRKHPRFVPQAPQ